MFCILFGMTMHSPFVTNPSESDILSIVVYSHNKYAYIHNVYYTYICRLHIGAIIKTNDTVLRKIYLSLYLKGSCVREGVGDQTELQHIDPHSYGHQHCVFLVLLMLNQRPGGSAFCWLSLPHLVTNSPDLQLTDFLSSPSYIIVQSPTQSLEWHV